MQSKNIIEIFLYIFISFLIKHFFNFLHKFHKHHSTPSTTQKQVTTLASLIRNFHLYISEFSGVPRLFSRFPIRLAICWTSQKKNETNLTSTIIHNLDFLSICNSIYNKLKQKQWQILSFYNLQFIWNKKKQWFF